MKASFLRNAQPTFAFGAGPPPGPEPAPGTAAMPSASPAPSPTPSQEQMNPVGSIVLITGGPRPPAVSYARLANRNVLVTNIHLMEGNASPEIATLDGSPVQVGNASAAVDQDILSFSSHPAASRWKSCRASISRSPSGMK